MYVKRRILRAICCRCRSAVQAAWVSQGNVHERLSKDYLGLLSVAIGSRY